MLGGFLVKISFWVGDWSCVGSTRRVLFVYLVVLVWGLMRCLLSGMCQIESCYISPNYIRYMCWCTVLTYAIAKRGCAYMYPRTLPI